MGRKHATSQHRFKPRLDRRRLQRGAVAIWVGVSIVAFIAATFLSIDVGRLYFTQRNLQKTATLAAISAAQIASGCTNGDGIRVDPDQMFSQVQALVIANGGQAGWLSGFNGFDAIEVGRTRTNSAGLRAFEPLAPGSDGINSVRVNLQRPAPSSFVSSILTGGGGTLKASSTAQQQVVGSLYIGSGLAELDNGLLNGLLTALLGSNVSLSVADYFALANTNVSLGVLATALNVQVTDLSNLAALGLDTPLLPNLLGGIASGLGSTASSTVQGLLTSLAGAAQGQQVPLGALLGPVTGIVADVPFINLLDLIVALGMAANVDDDPYANPIVVPLHIPIPNLVDVSVFLKVLEPPQFGIGPPGEATAKTAQVKLAVRIAGGRLINGLLDLLNGLLNLLRVLTLGAITPQILPDGLNLGVDVNVAQAAARLDEITCPSAANPQPVARLSASPAVATIHVGSFEGAPSVNPSTIPALDTSGTTFTVLGVRGSVPLVGSINLNVALDLTCISVGGACNGPSAPSTGPFQPLPNDVEQFRYEPDGSGSNLGSPYPYYQALGVPPEAEAARNPQTVGSELDLALNLRLHTLSNSCSGALCAVSDLLNGLQALIQGLLQGLLNLVNATVISLVESLLSLLGIQLGQAVVYMDAVGVRPPVRISNCLPGSTSISRMCPQPD